MLEGMEVIGLIMVMALAMLFMAMGLVWIAVMLWGLTRNLRDEEVEHAHTRRRLADVEALRPRAALPLKDWEIITDAIETFRSYQAHHLSKAGEEGRLEKADRNRVMAERLEGVVARLALKVDAGG